MSDAPFAAGRRAALPFILVVVFIDVLGIGLAMPVLPMLVGDYTPSRELQSYWYGALVIVYGLMQFFCAPLLGALSDRFGRRPVILASLFGLGLHYFLLAVAPSLWFMLLARVLGGITGASFSVANAYASDISSAEGRAKSFGLIGAAFGPGSSAARCSAGCSAASTCTCLSTSPPGCRWSTACTARSSFPNRCRASGARRSRSGAPTRSRRCSRCRAIARSGGWCSCSRWWCWRS